MGRPGRLWLGPAIAKFTGWSRCAHTVERNSCACNWPIFKPLQAEGFVDRPTRRRLREAGEMPAVHDELVHAIEHAGHRHHITDRRAVEPLGVPWAAPNVDDEIVDSHVSAATRKDGT